MPPQVLYKGEVAIFPPCNHICEADTTDVFYPARDANGMPASIVYRLDEPAQDSIDMTGAEMEHCLAQAISASTDGSGWVGTYCTQAEVSKALTIMVATKINLFCTNHHVG